MSVEQMGVAEAKRRFAELAERVGRGESFVVLNRGRPALALVPPHRAQDLRPAPLGLAAFAGALGHEWPTVDDDLGRVVADRARSTDRADPFGP